jgi:ATP-dependent DNA helicase RecG
MPENQNVEYKSSWRDKYLKWICGFANAQGGKLYIGIDDDGEVCGVQNAKKLMEDIPNKIQTCLGVVTEINKRERGGLEYIEIVVDPSSYPIRQAERIFAQLKQKKLIVRKGARKNGYWQIVKDT